jgi:hypothetical protein
VQRGSTFCFVVVVIVVVLVVEESLIKILDGRASSSGLKVQEDIPHHFKKGMVCQFLNGMACSRAISEAAR